MKKVFAEELMAEIHELSNAMNSVAAKIEELDSGEDKLKLREGIADLMGALYSDIMRPVILKYPELDPDL